MPKSRTFRIVVAGSPAEVRARLDASTHLRTFPSIGRAVGLASKPLAGRVAEDGTFNVAKSDRDFFRRMRPVARGTIKEGAAGTVIEGTAGLPPWVTWYLRIVFVALGLAALGTAGAWALGLAGGLAAVAPALLLGVVVTAVAIGLHVGHADRGVDDLVAALERAAGAAVGTSAGVSAAVSGCVVTDAAVPAATGETDPRAGTRARQHEG